MDIRPATMDDAELLYAWRNDPVTRQNSINPEPVEWAGHVSWLGKRLSLEAPGLFIAVTSEPVGTVRIDGDEISYTVAPEHRGKGIATKMLTLARERFGAKEAQIKTENLASISAATKAGHHVQIIKP